MNCADLQNMDTPTKKPVLYRLSLIIPGWQPLSSNMMILLAMTLTTLLWHGIIKVICTHCITSSIDHKQGMPKSVATALLKIFIGRQLLKLGFSAKTIMSSIRVFRSKFLFTLPENLKHCKNGICLSEFLNFANHKIFWHANH